MDFPSTPYFPYFHYFGPTVAHFHFSTSHTVHGFAFPLFPTPFRPVYFLEAHLFISWACNPLFLPLGFNGFSIHLLTLFCPHCWASSFYWASKNDHQQLDNNKIMDNLNFIKIYFKEFIHKIIVPKKSELSIKEI